MPFEVHPIEGARDFLREGVEERTVEQVAGEIKDTYERVAKGGGQIIAAHEVHIAHDKPTANHAPWLVLVAEYIPDTQA